MLRLVGLVYGGKIQRFAPDDSPDLEIDTPVKKVTSVMFGGPNLDILFVTSMLEWGQVNYRCAAGLQQAAVNIGLGEPNRVTCPHFNPLTWSLPDGF